VAIAPLFGYRGLALAASTAALFNAGMLVWLARGALGGLQLGRVAVTGVKTVAAAIAMALAGWLTLDAVQTVLPGTGLLPQAARLLLAIAVSLGVLAAAAQLLRIREFEEVRDAVVGRLRRVSKR
jgi:peptidoglycan biosynthesis protein MviN/MurJ (putative lipid II flippase)